MPKSCWLFHSFVLVSFFTWNWPFISHRKRSPLSSSFVWVFIAQWNAISSIRFCVTQNSIKVNFSVFVPNIFFLVLREWAKVVSFSFGNSTCTSPSFAVEIFFFFFCFRSASYLTSFCYYSIPFFFHSSMSLSSSSFTLFAFCSSSFALFPLARYPLGECRVWRTAEVFSFHCWRRR